MKRLNTLIASLMLAAIAAAPGVQADEERSRGRDFMTADEWAAHGNTMRTLSSQQERERYRAAMHEQMAQRAAAQGVTLSGGPGTPRGGRGYGSLDGDHRGYGGHYSDADDSYGAGRGYGRGRNR